MRRNTTFRRVSQRRSVSTLTVERHKTLEGRCFDEAFVQHLAGSICFLLLQFFNSPILQPVGQSLSQPLSFHPSILLFNMFSSLWSLAVLAAGCEAAVSMAGVNIAGFDFGCDTSGNCTPDNSMPPITDLGGSDGAAQMKHFADDLGLNVFRLPVSWQYLTNSNIGSLDESQFANYDGLVQSCLSTGASCVIDVSCWTDPYPCIATDLG
jgi:hypothetical protein